MTQKRDGVVASTIGIDTGKNTALSALAKTIIEKRGRLVDSYDHGCCLGRLLQDALALPIFAGGNIGVRRRQLHAILKRSDYDPLIEGRDT